LVSKGITSSHELKPMLAQTQKTRYLILFM
jgi:hypothetical protein